MGREAAAALNLGKAIMGAGLAILGEVRKEGGKMKIAHKLVGGGATAIGGEGSLGKENVFSKAKNYKEATVIWEELTKKLKEEASEDWEGAADKFLEAVRQSEEAADNMEGGETTELDEASFSEFEAQVSEYYARVWEEEAKGWGMALKTMQEKANYWEEKARHWEGKAVKWALGGSSS